MTYLDYSATTPVDEDILNVYNDVTRNYIGNVNSIHDCGEKSRKLYENSILEICKYFDCIPSEIIITSGASESNSLAILGTVLNKGEKKHIITSKLEHKSILDLIRHLKIKNIDIDYVRLLPNGQVDLDDLDKLINENTILVSICGVNSETGYKQDLKKINSIIKRHHTKYSFNSDFFI